MKCSKYVGRAIDEKDVIAGADGAVGHGGLHKGVAFIFLYSTARRGFAQGLCGKRWKIQIGSSGIHSNKIF
jgi:hypothetical protein